jgi:hypothetical protein
MAALLTYAQASMEDAGYSSTSDDPEKVKVYNEVSTMVSRIEAESFDYLKFAQFLNNIVKYCSLEPLEKEKMLSRVLVHKIGAKSIYQAKDDPSVVSTDGEKWFRAVHALNHSEQSSEALLVPLVWGTDGKEVLISIESK